MTNTIANDTTCTDCGAEPRFLACIGCGVSAQITDCGHMAQPRPIAPDATGRPVCDTCCDGGYEVTIRYHTNTGVVRTRDHEIRRNAAGDYEVRPQGDDEIVWTSSTLADALRATVDVETGA